MIKILYSAVMLLLVSNLSFADGHALPKKGTINYVTGFQFNMDSSEPQSGGWNIMMGKAIGATFNVDGSGPLHEGRALCAATMVMSESVNTFNGNCYFGDKDGDRIFTNFKGSPITNSGENIIIGGTGKYTGISGKGPWECDGSKPGDHGAFNCRQTLTYSIN
jgi:hypothetical protein